MSEPIRWGILGAAKFAREHMGPAIHMAEGAELAAVASRDVGKVADFQAFAPSVQAVDGYEAMLARSDIEAIYIPLPNTAHVEWTKKALAAGKHVLCEKPIAMTAGEFDGLIAARDQSDLVAAEAYMIVHHPQWQRARELLADGAIGKLVHVSGAFSFDNRADVDNIRNKADMGGGAIRDIGVYVIGSARFVTGLEASEVSGDIRWENGFDAFTRIRARFGEATYDAYVSTRAHPHQEMVFHGEKGVMRLTAPFNPRVFGEAQIELSAGMTRSVERFPTVNHYVLQVEAFGRSIREGADYPCPLEFSRGTQVVIDKVFETAR